MKLNELLEPVDTLDVAGSQQADIEGVVCDSRQVKPGYLFVAIAGAHSDGAGFIAQALSNGAVAVVSEGRLDLGRDVVHVQVPNARCALAELANVFFGDLSSKMMVIGVTGTNGKTTTSYMIRSILRAGGCFPGLLGTVAYEIGDRSIPATRTTPEAPAIHSMFRQMVEHGCDSVVMEVSSHAIALERVRAIHFKTVVFTNLTQDHLDFHQDMESYFNTKSMLFESMAGTEGQAAVVNIDDPWGCRLVEDRRLDVNVLTYGFDARAQVRADGVRLDLHGTRFNVETPWGSGLVRLKLLGRFNVHNALAAIAAGGLGGAGFAEMVRALERLESVPGRLELVTARKGRKVFVDYAHTDDALKNVLKTLREICKGRLIVVFGCGGNRDRGKREKMGRVASELADYVIVTSDNPRREDPTEIAGDIVAGFADADGYTVMLDRREAIEAGLRMVRRKDVLLIAGKGHETYQEFADTIVPFDDRQVVREILG